jgi:hypothetical protein
LPIRHLAGRVAATAPPKNYQAQIKSIYKAITVDWWRYTFDPVGAEVLTVDPRRIFDVTLGRGFSNHRGYGDCDDIACASGALLNSIGFKTLIATTVKPNSPYIFDHVFIFVRPPNEKKWIPFDPVLYPHKGYGDITKFKRLALWSLDGKLIEKRGPFPPHFNEVMRQVGNCQPARAKKNFSGTERIDEMQNQKDPNYHDFYDYSQTLGFLGEVDTIPQNQAHMLGSDDVLPDFARHGIVGFGAYSGMMGCLTGAQVPNIMAEYDDTDTVGNTGLVRTKHFELAPDDYEYVRVNGYPRIGTLALADDGEIYDYAGNPDGLGGFFKKLIKKAKKGVRRLAKGVKKRIKKFVKRLPMGKLLWKVGSRIHETAMKLVKPLLKIVGPIAKKIAPIAALIPGIGTAVAAGLMITGKVYDIAKKVGVKFDSKKQPIIKNKEQGRAFSQALARAGQKMGKRGASAAIAAYKAKKSGGSGSGIDSMINPAFLGAVYSSPEPRIVSRICPYAGIGWL